MTVLRVIGWLMIAAGGGVATAFGLKWWQNVIVCALLIVGMTLKEAP